MEFWSRQSQHRRSRRRSQRESPRIAAGWVPHAIFEVVLKPITVRGSIVGTGNDLSEAIAFAADGKVKTRVSERRLDDINDIFAEMKKGQIGGRNCALAAQMTGQARCLAKPVLFRRNLMP
jgi:hypothetical protein